MLGWRADETAADLFGRLAHAPLRLPCLPTGLHAGEAFGESALITEERRLATVSAVEPGTLLQLSARYSRETAERQPRDSRDIPEI